MFLDMKQFHNETLFKSDNWSFVLHHLHSIPSPFHCSIICQFVPLYLIYLAEMEMGKNENDFDINQLLEYHFPTHIN